MKTLASALVLLPLLAAFTVSAQSPNPRVAVKTSMGSFTIELHEKEAPGTVRNFLAYVDEGFYAGTIFHRVIDGFMIQGGGLDREMNRKKTRDPIANEAMNKLKNRVGTVAMARTSSPNSATSQFFVNVADNGMLDYRDTSAEGIGYCVFGKVVEGMDVVEKIKAVPTGVKNGMRDVPETPVVIESITRVKSDA
ncbi:MAG TPA: peptidylprolyl isomerase [Thermoanaerobaculia bacterium]|jgi:cyclophilin family peptidyl-prolyl cis-trans isomerase|nr:peptidylprolyl isomerase [Thermoanaerobaculia bacterium]HQN08530.1 peptidylprolyl isomerase [Thermoanaerobaculia bacterium]HQP88680.1 peptidylprolyl isomerase [Thermoanaerobaculia bacterium]